MLAFIEENGYWLAVIIILVAGVAYPALSTLGQISRQLEAIQRLLSDRNPR